MVKMMFSYAGSKHFSKCDGTNRYWCISLERPWVFSLHSTAHLVKVSYLDSLTLVCSQDMLWCKMDQILQGWERAMRIGYDICISEKNEAEHSWCLDQPIEVVHKHSLILYPKKFYVKAKQIKFFSCFYDAEEYTLTPVIFKLSIVSHHWHSLLSFWHS